MNIEDKAWQHIKQGKGYNNMFKDIDKDGLPNVFDCAPSNKNKQGAIHDFLERVKAKGRQTFVAPFVSKSKFKTLEGERVQNIRAKEQQRKLRVQEQRALRIAESKARVAAAREFQKKPSFTKVKGPRIVQPRTRTVAQPSFQLAQPAAPIRDDQFFKNEVSIESKIGLTGSSGMSGSGFQEMLGNSKKGTKWEGKI